VLCRSATSHKAAVRLEPWISLKKVELYSRKRTRSNTCLIVSVGQQQEKTGKLPHPGHVCTGPTQALVPPWEREQVAGNLSPYLSPGRVWQPSLPVENLFFPLSIFFIAFNNYT
jgi:hypothetical protein